MISRKFAIEALGGVVLLIIIYLILAGATVFSFQTLLLFAFLAPFLNFLWIITCISVSKFGEVKNMPGVAWSPVVLCVLWCNASVLHRAYLTIHTTNLGIEGGPPTMDLRGNTLSLLGPGEDCCWFYKALAEGKVARIVLASENVLKYKPEHERAITHARGEACHKPGQKIDKSGEYRLREAGRLDECFIETTVVGIPDGLIIRTRGYYSAGYRTDFTVRDGGLDTITGEWVKKGPQTLSYLPLIGLSASSSIGIWEPAFGGPIQEIRTGPQKQSQRGAAIVLFGDDIVEPIQAAHPPETATRHNSDGEKP